jgi:hypothetical protein
VPEATVDEDRDPSSPEDEIRVAWQLMRVQPVAPGARSPERFPEGHLDRGIAALDATHDLGAHGGVELIHEGSLGRVTRA